MVIELSSEQANEMYEIYNLILGKYIRAKASILNENKKIENKKIESIDKIYQIEDIENILKKSIQDFKEIKVEYKIKDILILTTKNVINDEIKNKKINIAELNMPFTINKSEALKDLEKYYREKRRREAKKTGARIILLREILAIIDAQKDSLKLN